MTIYGRTDFPIEPTHMPRLLIGNFDFEHTLATGGQPSPAGLRRIVAELACCWGVAAEKGDVLWCPELTDMGFLKRLQSMGLPALTVASQAGDVPTGLTLVPWGWTRDTLELGERVDAKTEAPPLDVVRRLNSRKFSHKQEQTRGVGLPGARRVESVNELQTAIDDLPSWCDGWVVKAEYSNSSRERFVHRGSKHVDFDALTRWAARRLARSHALFVEPWVERIDEVGVQLMVLRSGKPRVDGVTRLLVDAAGHFLGCEFTPAIDHDPLWTDAVRAGLEVAGIAQRAGYFGPLGIDAMRYRLPNGEERLRPLQDVNARWTMGRLSLGLRRLLGERGTSVPCGVQGTFRVRPKLAIELRNFESGMRS